MRRRWGWRSRAARSRSAVSSGIAWPRRVLGGLAGAIALFGLLGYLTGIDTLYGSSVRPPALPTAVGLLCVAGGVLLSIRAKAPRPQAPPLLEPPGLRPCAGN